jgi:hypothetical protein
LETTMDKIPYSVEECGMDRGYAAR